MSDRSVLSEIVVPPYEGPKPRKLFVGIRVSVPTANALSLAIETIARRATDAKLELKWVAPASYHVTLRYLGWTRPELLPILRDKLAEAIRGIAPFSFRTSRIGAFPSIEKATILWAGADEPRLVELAKRIESAVVDIGFPAEPRGFHGHVTLARLREARPLRDVVLPVSEQMFSESRATGITIIESETISSGSVYRDVEKIPFKTTETTSETDVRRQTEALQMTAPHDTETDDGWPRGQGPTDDF